MKKWIALSVAAAFAGVLAAATLAAQDAKATSGSAEKKEDSKMHRNPSGLQYEDTVVGTGATPQKGQTCVMHYTGWLWENNAKGKKFDSSVDRGKPFEFKLGQGQVIRGWDEGISTMKVGGKRTLLIPPDLAYGSRGVGNGLIPPNSTLVFDVELLDVK
jgi:peptidylprolyl isomerase